MDYVVGELHHDFSIVNHQEIQDTEVDIAWESILDNMLHVAVIENIVEMVVSRDEF
jgi:hypothetical protein